MKFANVLALGALMGCASATPTANQERRGTIGSTNGASKYLVKSLPQVNFPIPRSWAGNLEIGGKYGNDSLFFWLWEAESTKNRQDLIIWVNGGPGCSGQNGALKTHGPVIFPGTSPTPQSNPYAWTKAANVVYLDERVTAGFSIGTHEDPADPADVRAATVQWLKSFFSQFPELKSNKIHFMGESNAGLFLGPTVEAFQTEAKALGLRVVSLSLGNAVFGNSVSQHNGVFTRFLEANRNAEIAKISDQLLDVYKSADVNCGFKAIIDKLLTYPPSIRPTGYLVHHYANYKTKRQQLTLPQYPIPEGYNDKLPVPAGYNESLLCLPEKFTPDALAYVLYVDDDCWGQCSLQEVFESMTYLDNNFETSTTVNPYKIDETVSIDIGGPYYDNVWLAWLNRQDVQTAIHAPKIEFSGCNDPLRGRLIDLSSEPPAYRVLPSLLSKGIKVNIYSGDLDYVVPSLGSLVVIQNMTWNGKQGLQKPPGQVKLVDIDGKTTGKKGKQVGGYTVERGLSYSTFQFAGHRVAQDDPDTSLDWLKKVVIGC